MCVDAYIILYDKEGGSLIPVEFAFDLRSYILQEQFSVGWFLFEGLFFGDDESIFGVIRRQVVELCFLDNLEEVFRILLEEKDVCVDSNHILFDFLSFSLFIEKT